MLSRPKRDPRLDPTGQGMGLRISANFKGSDRQRHGTGMPRTGLSASGNGCCRDGAREGNASVEVSQTNP